MSAEEEAARKDPRYRLKALNPETADILNELDSTYKAPVSNSGVCCFHRASGASSGCVVVLHGSLTLEFRRQGLMLCTKCFAN